MQMLECQEVGNVDVSMLSLAAEGQQGPWKKPIKRAMCALITLKKPE